MQHDSCELIHSVDSIQLYENIISAAFPTWLQTQPKVGRPCYRAYWQAHRHAVPIWGGSIRFQFSGDDINNGVEDWEDDRMDAEEMSRSAARIRETSWDQILVPSS